MNPEQIVDKMLSNDAFSKELKMEIIQCKKGLVDVQLRVTSAMTNGFKIAHGAITYALADSALAFSSNTHGHHAVSIDTSIKHVQPVFENDIISTKVTAINKTKKIGVYSIKIYNQNNMQVALFHGTVYFKSTVWED